MTEFLMCYNCDYILRKEEGQAAATRMGETGLILCPSCNSEDCRKCPYDEQAIQDQLEWQREIAEKGVIPALLDLFSQDES